MKTNYKKHLLDLLDYIENRRMLVAEQNYPLLGALSDIVIAGKKKRNLYSSPIPPIN